MPMSSREDGSSPRPSERGRGHHLHPVRRPSSSSMTAASTRASGSSMSATSRWRPMPPTAMPARPASGCVACDGGTGLHQCGDRHRHRLPPRKPGAAYWRPVVARPAQRWARCRTCRMSRMMQPITKFAAGVFSTERVADMIAMAAREAFAGAPGPVYLEIARCARPRDRRQACGDPAGRTLSRLDPLDRRSARHREARRDPGQGRAPGHPSWPAGVDARGQDGAIALLYAASTFPAISTALRAACYPRAPPIISTGRARSPSPRRMSSSSSARRSTSAWAMASGSACRRWCRSTWTTARSARIATSRSAWSGIRGRFSQRCSMRLRPGSTRASARRGSNG